MEKPLIEIGYDRNGEMDFGVLGTVGELSHKQMKEFREMIVVAIGTAEDMWRRNQPQTAQAEDMEKLSMKVKHE